MDDMRQGGSSATMLRPPEGRDDRLARTNSGQPFGDRPWSGGTATGPEAIESVATIDRHPIHPMLVPLPIASVVGMLACDLAYAATRDPFFARASRHLTDAALVTGLAAGAVGAMDFSGRERIRRLDAAWFHAGGNLLVMGLALAGRMARGRDERAAVVPLGLALSAVSAGILGVTGWLGGELSYRHRVGVVPDAR